MLLTIRVRSRPSLSEEPGEERVMMVDALNGYPWPHTEEVLLDDERNRVLLLEDGRYAVQVPETPSDTWEILNCIPRRFEDLVGKES